MIGIIPCAGKGVRFKELGKHYPKAILPYNNKPILIHNIDKLLLICDEIRIVVGHQKEKIINVVEQFFPDNNKIKFVEQETFDGLSDAILQGVNKNKNEELLIVLGDILLNSDFIFDKGNFVSVKKVNDYSRWCMVFVDEYKVKKLYDKPKEKPNTEYAISGVYKFDSSQEVIDLIVKQKDEGVKINNEYQLSYVMERLENLYIRNDISILDFGTLEEYLENKNVTKCREFNELYFGKSIVTKRSYNRSKILNEYQWFKGLPDPLKIHTPHIFSSSIFEHEKAEYRIEKVLYPTLRDIFLFIDYSEETWESIFSKLFFYIKEEKKYTNSTSNFFIQDYFKLSERINKLPFNLQYKFKETIDVFLTTYRSICKKLDKAHKDTIMHGDFCFSNILYDINSNRFKLIDPKGTIYGSYLYDLAKLTHSVLYPYDYIDADLYFIKDSKVEYYDSGKDKIRKLFISMFKKEFGSSLLYYIKIITASLYLSMIPLHSHNKEHQQLFFEIFYDIVTELNNE